MRKFFLFSSLESRDESENSLHLNTLSADEKLCGTHSHNHLQNLRDPTLKAFNCYPETKDSSHLRLRRSRSLSSCSLNDSFPKGNLISLSDLCRPASSYGNSPDPASSCQMRYHHSPPQHSHAVQQYDSPSSLRDSKISAGNSPCCSPIPLRCNGSYVSQFLKRNEFLREYIDGGVQEVTSENCSSESANRSCLEENRTYHVVGRLQQVQSAVLSTMTYSKENTRTNSLEEANDPFHHPSFQNWKRDDCGAASSCRSMKKSSNKLSHPFPKTIVINSRDYDSESTTTFEDNNIDTSEVNLTLLSDVTSDDILQHCSYDDNFGGLEKYEHFLDNRIMDHSSGLQDTDEELLQKLKDMEKVIKLLAEEDCGTEELHCRDLDVNSLFQTVRSIKNDKKYLASNLLVQIKCRLAERCAAKQHLRQARIELMTRTRRLKREKDKLQICLKKEMERISSDWSMKLEIIQLEEQRLLERVCELEEQNVSFQREISSFKSKEDYKKSRTLNSEMEITNLTSNLEKLGIENQDLQKALTELQSHLSVTEKDNDCMRILFHEKEKENKELQKLVVRFQRMCNEQERTINGLRQAYSEEIENRSTNRSDQLSRLQTEQLRLTGIEQNLRRELKIFQCEVETLRHENIGLLTRLQASENGCELTSIKLEQELCAQVDCLRTEGLSLLNDISQFIDQLLQIRKHKHFENGQEGENCTNGYLFFEYSIKSQSFRRRHENFRRHLQTIGTILDEKSYLCAMNHQSLSGEGDMRKQLASELESKLKAEMIFSKLLQEKLHSNGLELERLEADLADSLRTQDVLQNEIQRMQDELSCLSHKTTNMELKMLRKDESIKQLQNEYQDCRKELTAARNMFMKVTQERDHMWEEVKSSREKIMLLNYEVLSLQKKIEELDEDILTKEGQISILRDSLAKPFDLIPSPRSVKEFSLE